MIQDIYPAFIPAVTFLLKDKFSLTYFQITLILVFLRLPCLFNPLLGLITNKKVIKAMIISPPMLSALFIGLLGLSPSYHFILLFSFLAGTSAQIFHVPSPVLIKRLSAKSLGKGMSIYMMGGELARTLGPFLITWFLTMFSFDKIYILSILGIIYSTFLFFSLKVTDDIFLNTHQEQSLKDSWKLFFKKKNLIFTILGTTLSKAFTASVVVSLIALYLKENDHSVFLSGNSLSIIAIASFLGVSITGPLSDKFGRRHVILASAVLAPLILVLLIYSSSTFAILTSLFLFGFIACSTAPVIITYVQECSEDIPSFSNGIYMYSAT